MSITIFFKICFDKNLFHGDFYPRNCLWNKTVEPPALSLIDFDRAEIITDRDKLGRAWINSIVSYFFEVFEKASCDHTNLVLAPMVDPRNGMKKTYDMLMWAFFRATFIERVIEIETFAKRRPSGKPIVSHSISLEWDCVEEWCPPPEHDNPTRAKKMARFHSPEVKGSNFRLSKLAVFF